MNVTIFIVTYAKDFDYLKYCLRSIAKFADGFSGVTILVPTQDEEPLVRLLKQLPRNEDWTCGTLIKTGDEWPDKGFLWHSCQIFRADEWCPSADFIAHFDPDCIFTEPVTPETFIKDGKPILQYESFRTLRQRCPGVLNWKMAAEACLPFPVNDECMRGHPEVYPRWLYPKVRELVELKTHMAFDDYMKAGKNNFPQDRAEFPTIGAVAKHLFPGQFTLVDNGQKANPDKSDFPVIQFWSHSDIDKPQDGWIFGRQETYVPMDIIKQYGL